MSMDIFGTSDEVKLKSSAPKRPILKRKAIHREVPKKDFQASEKFVKDVPILEEERDEGYFVDDYEESFDPERSPAMGGLEAGWNGALLELLNRLEPADAQAIYEQYMSEQDAYQAEFEALMAEKQQNPHSTEVFQTEEAAAQLEYAHELRLQEILGAHYEAVKDHYEGFMEAAEVEEAYY